jgi:hypothetical protein
MQSTSRITISGQVSGMLSGYKYVGPLTVTNTTHAIGAIRDIATVSIVAGTPTTVTVPKYAIGCIIAMTSSNAGTTLRIATNLDSRAGTTWGCTVGFIGKCPYAMIPLKTPTTTTARKLYLHSTTTAMKNIEITFF